MRTFKQRWKELRIFTDYFIVQIKEDFQSMFKSSTTPDTYVGFLTGILKDFKKALTRPRYHVYYALFFLIMAIAKYEIIIIVIASVLVVFFYIRSIWLSGEPLKFYKDKYYGKT